VTDTAADTATTYDRGGPPPHDIGAERAVLGGIIGDPVALADVSRIIDAGDFYRPVHGTVFNALHAMAQRGQTADHVSLMTELHNSGDLVRVGGAPFIAELIEYAVGDPRHHAGVIADRAEERRWLSHAHLIEQAIRQPGQLTRDRRDLILTDHEQVVRGRALTRGRWAGDIIGDAIDHMAAAAEGLTTARTVPTGFADLDRLLGGGLHAGQLVIVAGRPGRGKSTLASDFTRSASLRHDMTSMVVSLEMSDVELMLRWISAETGLPFAMIRSGDLRDDEWEQVTRLIDRFVANRIAVYDDPDMYMPQIRAEARRLRRQHDLRLLILDYLQLMSNPQRKETRQQEVSDLSRGLKLLAKEIEVPVVAAAQLNRNPESRSDKRPTLADLRESGSIEQDADVVILLFDDPDNRPGEMDFIVAKHRNGPTATITVANQTHLARFADMRII
jgi:replicative DNA helicase